MATRHAVYACTHARAHEKEGVEWGNEGGILIHRFVSFESLSGAMTTAEAEAAAERFRRGWSSTAGRTTTTTTTT